MYGLTLWATITLTVSTITGASLDLYTTILQIMPPPFHSHIHIHITGGSSVIDSRTLKYAEKKNGDGGVVYGSVLDGNTLILSHSQTLRL